VRAALTLLFVIAAAGCGPGRQKGSPSADDPAAIARETASFLAVPLTPGEMRTVLSLSPLPEPPRDPTNAVESDPRAVRLGHALFYDARLSGNGKVSCATCHDPAKSWTDGRAVFEAIGKGMRNTPALWNAAGNRWFLWDGRTDSLWAQALQPIENPIEMGGSRTAVAALIAGDAALRRDYEAIFGALPDRGAPQAPQEIDRAFANAGKAIAAFERTIVTLPSPFDVFVSGLRERRPEKIAALPAPAQRGLALFVGRAQCTLCHHGPLLSDREFHNVGLGPSPELPVDRGRWDGVERVLADPFNGQGAYSDAAGHAVNDRVRYVVQKPNNLGEFKTPTLRHVGETAPYMHDGRFATLEDVLRFYSDLPDRPALGHREESLRPLALSAAEIAELGAFLRALSGPPPSPAQSRPPAD
jgi:cytochrome c peroxidase